jgi:TolB-like protein/Flp pilus assembly protein TadD
MQVLVCLVQHAGEPVSKEELMKTVWPDTFVTDDVLTRSVSELRRVFEDDAKDSHVIQTIPKRGYRLLAAILPVNSAPVPEVQAPPVAVSDRAVNVASHRKVWIGALAFLSIAVLLSGLVIEFNVGGLRDQLWGTKIHSLAVLPLANLSGDQAQEYFAEGMTDALITDLAQIGSLKVVSRTSTMRYKKSSKSLPEIARELNVDGIVEGTVQRFGDRVRTTAQLIHGPTDKHLWANSYERDLRDVLTVEGEVAQAIAAEIRASLTSQERARLAQPRPVNVKALDAYLQGKDHLDRAGLDRAGRGIGGEETRKAAEYFQQAIDADPNFVQAYIGLANAHAGFSWPSSEDSAIMKRAAERAVELDPSSSDARVILAVLKAERWDWSGAEEEFRRGIALNPNNSGAHGNFADFLDKTGRLDEGWKELQIALELNPNPDTVNLAQALYYRGDCDRAIPLLLRIVESHPNDDQSHLVLSNCYEQKGMFNEAIEKLGRAVTLVGYPEVAARMHGAFSASGYRGALLQFAQDIEHLQAAKEIFMPGYLATVYARLSDKDRAFYWLEESYNNQVHSGLGSDIYNWLKTDPMLKPLRTDPRYFDLLRRVGLPQ